jgi:type III restriction enzyme
VETGAEKYLCEIKDESELADAVVQLKAESGALWCERASEHSVTHGGKPWSYLLIRGAAVTENCDLAGLARDYSRSVSK